MRDEGGKMSKALPSWDSWDCHSTGRSRHEHIGSCRMVMKALGVQRRVTGRKGMIREGHPQEECLN